MTLLKNALNWFEIPVTDFDRAHKFYNAIYDTKMPESTVDGYRMGFFVYNFESGGIGGAIVAGEGYEPHEKGTLIYLNGGPDLSVVLDRVEEAGGTVLQEKKKISDEIGYYALFRDSEGNRVALHSMK